MTKPWARIEVGYLTHPKFLALTANAICLWHEGKNYSDSHQTDGIIPREALKTFRFRGAKSMALLMTSCGQKPDRTPYAPLWEAHPLGFRMHDYLDHNDCRDEVLDRIEKADERRKAEKQRKADWRARKAALSRGTKDGTGTSPSRSTTETESETPSESTKAGAPPAPTPHPIRDFLALHERLFVGRFGQKPPKYTKKDAKLVEGFLDDYGADAERYLRAFMASQNDLGLKAGFTLNIFRSQLASIIQSLARELLVETQPDWNGHVPPCSSVTACNERFFREGREKRQVAS